MAPAMDTLTTEEQRQVVELVQDFFRYQLHKRGVRWNPPGVGATTADPPDICMALRGLGDEFLAKYRENVVQMVERFDLPNGYVEPAYASVLDEMFAEGISWSRVVVSFVFSVEFAYHLIEKQLAGEQCIEQTSQWLMNYTALRVVPWVRTHTGWAGLIQFKEEHEGSGSDDYASVWPIFRNAFCGVAGVAIGALALGAFLTSRS